MRKLCFLSLFCLTAPAPVHLFAQETAQAPKAAYASVLGEVTAVDPATKQVTIKSDAGASTTVTFDDKTHFMKLAPGEKDLKKATDIEMSTLAVGDRALARVRKLDGSNTAPATTVVVMTKAEITKHQEANLAEWQKNGIMGTVTVVNPATKEVTLKAQGADAKQVVIEPSTTVSVRRYAPDSIRFSDAKPSSMAEIKAGDTVRVLGAKSEDGARVKPEEIVYGTFTRQVGTILSVDAANHTVRMTDLATKKPLTVKINDNTVVKKLSPMMAGMLARSLQGNRGGAAPGGEGAAGGPPAGAGRPPMGQGQQAQRQGNAGGGPGGGMGPGGPGGGMGPGGGRMDPARMIERAPVITLADLKAGDAIFVSSSAGSDPSSVTAISLIAGVEPMLTAPAASGGGRQSALDGAWSLDMPAISQ